MLRIIAFVAGETIKWLQLEIGLLHRGTEKLIEYKTYNQSIPYFNRLDYVSLIAQEEIYINNIEKLLNLRISRYGSVVRTIFLEISRILNHLLAVTSNAIDVGAFTPFLLGFEEREKLMSFYEAISGARMHSGFLRLGGISVDVPLYLFDQIYKWLNVFPIKLQDIHTVLTGNRIWRVRLADVGILTKQMINGFSLTGVLLRGSNIKIDLRLIGYEYYSNIRFNVVTGVKGDCLRFMFSWCKLALAKLQNHERQSILLLIYFLSKWDWKGILGFDFEKQQKTWQPFKTSKPES